LTFSSSIFSSSSAWAAEAAYFFLILCWINNLKLVRYRKIKAKACRLVIKE
jgi:hypothetical protein